MGVGVVTGLAMVEGAVRRAANATGVDFDFLLHAAKRESGLNPNAKAATSSAAGLFQFTEQTWLATLKRHGPAHGYARYAELIGKGADGRWTVPGGEEARRTVMDLRLDPHASAVMAAELASDHAAYLRGRMGRNPTGGELYAAHFLGPEGSARLIEAAYSRPAAPASSLFPDAAASNRSVFFKAGRPVSVSELYDNLSATGGPNPAAGGPIANDPGEGAFAAYAGAGRLERLRTQTMLVDLLLGDERPRSPFTDALAAGLMAQAAKPAP